MPVGQNPVLRAQLKLLSRIKLIWVVQSYQQKYSAS
jgi:hypothetical protein